MQIITTLSLLLIFPLLISCGQQKDKTTAIEYAEQGNLLKIEQLIETGQNMDIVDSCQWTPLMKAAQYGHIDIVRLLLLEGVNIDQTDKGGYTALLLAASMNQDKIIELLIKNGANINHQEQTMGWTALIWATKLSHFETTKVLLENLANKQIKDKSGKSAIDWSRLSTNQAIKELYL